ncbi:MAG: ribonuclease HI [Peptococcaceae bacterium]|nr:ribonuclease HI [Peptococcaceae bacterium]
MPRVQIYTDGACSGNPGPGGYGAILKYGKHTRELSGGYRRTTNNRMELMAVIKSLEELKRPCRVDLHSDSRYVVDAFNLGWVNNWQKSGWVKEDRSPVKNADLWKRLIELSAPHRITWIWVRGHSDNEFNSRCDRLAVEASRGDNLAVDRGYEDQAT